MPRLELSFAIHDNPRTRALVDGRISIEGVEPVMSFVHGSEVYWRQLAFADFDVSEMSIASLLILHDRARQTGEPVDWVALPVFTTRSYMHTRVLIRTDRGITAPADLHGRRVGVPEYQQSSAVWARGVLGDEFGFDPARVEWYMERTPEVSHAGSTGFEPPPGVVLHRIPADRSIGDLLKDGSLDATLLYISGDNLVDRSRGGVTGALVRPLFDPPEAEARRFFERTGMFPVNHALVIRRSVVARHPWVVLNIFHAFVRARDRAVEDVRAYLRDYATVGLLDRQQEQALRHSRFPYGIQANRRELATLCRYAHEQGLTKELVTPESVFDERVRAL